MCVPTRTPTDTVVQTAWHTAAGNLLAAPLLPDRNTNQAWEGQCVAA